MARMATTYSAYGPETFMGTSQASDLGGDVFQSSGTQQYTRDLSAHEHLFFEGDDVSHFYEVECGVVCVYKLLPDGRRHVMNFCFPGDLIALSAQDEHRYSAEAIEAGTVRCIPKSTLADTIRQSPDFACKIIDVATTELAQARDQVLTVSRRSALERMASFFMGLSRRNVKRGDDQTVLHLPMTRLDIADFLGLTLETVSRTISKLKKSGIIDLPHSSIVVVRNMQELETLAEV